MKWIAKHPPLYVWEDDEWYCEVDKLVYKANLKTMCWEYSEKRVPFTKKTKIMKNERNCIPL